MILFLQNIEEINLNEFEDIKFDNNKLKTFFVENSAQKLTSESQEPFKKEILFIENDIKDTLFNIEKKEFKNI